MGFDGQSGFRGQQELDLGFHDLASLPRDPDPTSSAREDQCCGGW